ncbi:MAG TPA: hypothetical protein VEC35_16375 [Noviherbaspirillum sp.]|nr:hypothetical protein [Noviherbaspirillum sp.]
MSDGQGQPPSTAKEAAIRVILGELGPMLEKADAAATMLREAHELIEKDLGALGGLVRTLEKAMVEVTDQITYLSEDVKAERAKYASIATTGTSPKSSAKGAAEPGLKLLAVVAVVSGIVAAAVTAGALMFLNQQNQQTLEQAKLGRAVANAVPHLDPGTKQKLQAAMQKAGS